MDSTLLRCQPIRICGITLIPVRFKKIKIIDALWTISKSDILKAILIAGNDYYIMWDILTDTRDLVERIKYQTYSHVAYDNIIKSWYSGSEIQIICYHKEDIYVFKFDKNHDIVENIKIK